MKRPPRRATIRPRQLAELETKACCYCKRHNVSAFRCREQLSHIAPNWDAASAATYLESDVAQADLDASRAIEQRDTLAGPEPSASRARPTTTPRVRTPPAGRPARGGRATAGRNTAAATAARVAAPRQSAAQQREAFPSERLTIQVRRARLRAWGGRGAGVCARAF